jgi:dTDP-4-amino-4,6-dideoxygalactose transaminase
MQNLPDIPMSSPDLTEAERQAIAAVMQTPSLSMGEEIKTFEAAFSSYTGRRHAIGVNSGTAGLHLCVRAAGITDGDLVITTPFSFVASANVLLFERAVPVFVDVDSSHREHRSRPGTPGCSETWPGQSKLPGGGCPQGAGKTLD